MRRPAEKLFEELDLMKEGESADMCLLRNGGCLLSTLQYCTKLLSLLYKTVLGHKANSFVSCFGLGGTSFSC